MNPLESQKSSSDGNRYSPLTRPMHFPNWRSLKDSGTDFFKKKTFSEMLRFHGMVDANIRANMHKHLQEVFQSVLFRYSFTRDGETDTFMESTLPYLKYYSHESLQDELSRLKEMKKRMKLENENGVKELQLVCKDKKKLFRKKCLGRFLEWYERNEQLEKSIKEKTSSGTVKINFHTILSRIFFNCSDTFEIIFSFLPLNELIQRVSLSCSFFYSFILSRVKLSITITKTMMNVDYDIMDPISNFQFRRIDLDCGEYLEYTKIGGLFSKKDQKIYEGILSLIDRNKKSLEYLDFGMFRGITNFDYGMKRYGSNKYTLMPLELMNAVRSCSRLKTLKMIHLTDRFSDFLDSVRGNLKCLKFSIEDLLYSTSRKFDEEMTPLRASPSSPRLEELSVVHCILKNYRVPKEDVQEVTLRKTKFNDYVCSNLTNLRILHTNFVDCREFTELFTRYLVHQLEKVTIIRNNRREVTKFYDDVVDDDEKESLKIFEERVNLLAKEISRRENLRRRVPQIQFVYYNEYCEMTPLKIRYKKSERLTYNYIEEIQLLLSVPQLYIQMSSSMVVLRRRREDDVDNNNNTVTGLLSREDVGLVPYLDFSVSRIRTLYLNQAFYFSNQRVNQKLENVLASPSNIEDLIISFRDQDTLSEICELVPKSRGLKYVCMIIERGVATVEEKKVILEKILSLVEKNIPSLEKIAIYGNSSSSNNAANITLNEEEEEEEEEYNGYFEGPYVFDVSDLEVMCSLKKMKESFLEKLSKNPFLDELWIPDLGSDFQKKIDEVLIVNQSVYAK